MSYSSRLHAQGLQTVPRSFSLNAYSNKQKEAFSFAGNPASLAQCTRWSAAVCGERPYLLPELSTYKGVISVPVASGGVVFNGGYSGQALYHELSFGLGYGRKLGKLDAGLQFNYSQVSAGHYGKASAIQVQGGLIYQATDLFRTGIHIINPVSGSLHSLEKLPYQYAAAFGYDASDQFFLGAAIKKTRDHPVSFDLGLQYAFDQKLRVRTGFHTEGAEFYVGGGFRAGNLRFDVVINRHAQLGFSPSLTISYYPQEK
ncbi:MAG: hypothetical protein ACXWV0_08940 [Flavisolibacter sp.]